MTSKTRNNVRIILSGALFGSAAGVVLLNCPSFVSGIVLGTFIGWTAAALCAAAGRADELAAINAAMFVEPETFAPGYGPVVGDVQPGDQCRRRGSRDKFTRAVCIGLEPFPSWEYRRPISPVADSGSANATSCADSTSPACKDGRAGLKSA